MFIVLRDIGEVYVTDHSPRPRKLHTNSQGEDMDFYNYEQKLREFHSDAPEKAYSGDVSEWQHPWIAQLSALHKGTRNPDGMIIYS